MLMGNYQPKETDDKIQLEGDLTRILYNLLRRPNWYKFESGVQQVNSILENYEVKKINSQKLSEKIKNKMKEEKNGKNIKKLKKELEIPDEDFASWEVSDSSPQIDWEGSIKTRRGTLKTKQPKTEVKVINFKTKEIKGPVILLFDKIVGSVNTLQRLEIERREKELEEYKDISDTFVDKHISSI